MMNKFKEVPSWEDVFNISTSDMPDKVKWSMENHISDTNCVAFTPRKENIRIENNVLKICLLRENYNSVKRTSASLKSRKAFTSGKLEIEAKFPHGNGVWGAIWLQAENGSNYHGEIDIAEHVGWYSIQKYQANIHIIDINNIRKQYPHDVGANVTEYHIYGIEWYDDKIFILLDDNVVHELKKSEVSIWPFTSIKYHLILSLNYGGWAGNPNYNDTTPYIFEIKSIKYYELI